jgi:hypothetical protein
MKKISTIAILFFSVTGYSQNNNSPYSIIGIGDLESNYFNRTAGMAGAGVSVRDERYLIDNNPASYSALQQQFFNFEIAGRGQFVTYTGDPVNNFSNHSKDFSIERLALGTRITKRWGSGIGFNPFSSSTYGFSSFKAIQGTNESAPVQYDGTGGVNQVYWANGFEVTKHFSLGINASYLFGSLTQTERFNPTSLATSLTTIRQAYLRSFYFVYGAQYYFPVTKKWDVSLGATYSANTHLAAEYTVNVTDNTGTILNNTLVKNDYFKLPPSTVAGLSLTRNKKYTFSTEYKYQPWSVLQYSGINYALADSHRFSGGFQVSNKKRAWNNLLFEKSFLQAGVYYGTSYLDVKGQQLKDAGITIGYGFNSTKNPLGATLTLQVGQRGTTQNGLVKESYVNIGVLISYRDFWLTKGKKYY